MSARRSPAEVVFVPGFMQHGEAWRAVASVIGERYPTTALDPRATSFEGRLAEIGVAAEGAALVGYSMGGRLALHAAVEAPRRLRALAVVGASAGIEDGAERARRRWADEDLAAWIESRPIDAVVERWESAPVFASQSPELRAAQRPGRLDHDPRELAALLRSAGQGALPPIWDRLAGITCPTLTLAGELDRDYVAAARRIAALVPRGEARVIAGAGHAPQLEAPEEVAEALLDFLDEHLR